MIHRIRVLILRVVCGLAVVLLMAVMSCDSPESGPAESSLRMPVELPWKYEVPQMVSQNFFVEDGIVVVGLGSHRYGSNELRELHALDVETGSVLWSFTSGYGPHWDPDSIHLYNGNCVFLWRLRPLFPREGLSPHCAQWMPPQETPFGVTDHYHPLYSHQAF